MAEFLNEKLVEDMVVAHMMQAKGVNYDYYLGKREVDKGEIPGGRPDNQANTNIAKYITDTATGFFCGIPPVYVFEDERMGEIIRGIYDANDEESVNYDIAQNMSIAGVGYDLVYIGEDKNVKIASIDPRTCFVIYEPGLNAKAVAGVRYWQEGKYIEGEVYEAGRTRMFKIKNKLEFTCEYATPFSSPNLTEYTNNSFKMGDFECVTKNIDAYNLTISNVTDDLQSIAGAYLVLSGFEKPDEDTLNTLKTQRVLGMPSDGAASYITKNLNDSAVENHKKTLKEDILQVAGVPDLSDDSFSSVSSGVALKYKTWGIVQLFAKKRASMEKGLFLRLKLVSEAVSGLFGFSFPDVCDVVTVKFTQNFPEKASVEHAVALKGIVSDKTVFELLEPITQVRAHDEELRAEKSQDKLNN